MIYPLAQVLEIKKMRVEDAEKVLNAKKALLDKELEKLKLREEERDKVKMHQMDKLQQLRQEMDHDTTTDKIEKMRAYLKLVKEKLKVEEKKVKDQKDQVTIAEKNVELAREDLKHKKIEVDKFEMHRDAWEKEQRRELDLIEERNQDELGNLIYSYRKRG